MSEWRTSITKPDCPCHANRWQWEVEFTYPDRGRESGYTYTYLGAKFAVWRVEHFHR